MSRMWRTIRFLADENFKQVIVTELRRRAPTIDVLTVTEAGLRGKGDPVILAFAANESGVLLTHDEHTMPAHHGDFLAAGNHTPGVMILDQDLPIGTAIDAILFIWEASELDDWHDQMRRLPL